MIERTLCVTQPDFIFLSFWLTGTYYSYTFDVLRTRTQYFQCFTPPCYFLSFSKRTSVNLSAPKFRVSCQFFLYWDRTEFGGKSASLFDVLLWGLVPRGLTLAPLRSLGISQVTYSFKGQNHTYPICYYGTPKRNTNQLLSRCVPLLTLINIFIYPMLNRHVTSTRHVHRAFWTAAATARLRL